MLLVAFCISGSLAAAHAFFLRWSPVRRQDSVRYIKPIMLVQTGDERILTATMVLFGLREDTGLVGQQYSW